MLAIEDNGEKTASELGQTACVTYVGTVNTVEGARPKAGHSHGASLGGTFANTRKDTFLIRLDHSREKPRQQLGRRITSVTVLMAPCS